MNRNDKEWPTESVTEQYVKNESDLFYYMLKVMAGGEKVNLLRWSDLATLILLLNDDPLITL